MGTVAISASHLGKRYRLGVRPARYRTMRDALAHAMTATLSLGRPGRCSPASPKAPDRDLWALRDVSFEISHGDVVGIVGRNGAGKSTLLKILSRITRPTAGHAVTYGRVGCLLEVGTGFHNELTGRENIFLNGAIMGMRRTEITRKFDEIVAFAEVERFIDTAVKHYSSGMYLRLAFAVAAHLEPDILLVDEVLAVGDAAFQKKCLGKMGDVASEGRTILFVSHNMGAVRALCRTGLVLEQGTVATYGPVARAIEAYYANIGALQRTAARDGSAENGEVFGPVLIDGRPGTSIRQSEPFRLSTMLRVEHPINGFSLFWIVEDMQGRPIIHLREESPDLVGRVEPGSYAIDVSVPPLWLTPGLYTAYFKALWWGDYASARHLSDKLPLDVAGPNSATDAILHPRVRWSVEPRDALVPHGPVS